MDSIHNDIVFDRDDEIGNDDANDDSKGDANNTAKDKKSNKDKASTPVANSNEKAVKTGDVSMWQYVLMLIAAVFCIKKRKSAYDN